MNWDSNTGRNEAPNTPQYFQQKYGMSTNQAENAAKASGNKA